MVLVGAPQLSFNGSIIAIICRFAMPLGNAQGGDRNRN